MRVLYVCGKLYASGGENVLRSVIDGIKEYDAFQVLALRVPEEYSEYHGVEIVSCSGGLFDRIKKLKKIIRQYKIDTVISFGFPFNLDCSLLKLFTKVKVILCERQDPVTVRRTRIQKIEKALLYPLANAYVVQTNRTKEYYCKHYTRKRDRVAVIPNPVRYEKPPMVEKTRDKCLVTVGRYENQQKNHLLFMEAFSKLRAEYPDYSIKLYGEGPDRKLYEQYIAENGMDLVVQLMGYTSHPLTDIANAELFVFTSNHEGMPNALIEAMSIGLPCIATDCGGGGAADLIADGKNGLLIEKGNCDQLCQAIKKLLNDKAYANSLGEEAYMINEDLSLSNIIGKWHLFMKQQSET